MAVDLTKTKICVKCKNKLGWFEDFKDVILAYIGGIR